MNILQSIETLSDADAKKARTKSRKLIKAALQKENIQTMNDINPRSWFNHHHCLKSSMVYVF